MREKLTHEERDKAEHIYRKYGSLMMMLAVSTLHDTRQAEDIVQQAMQRVMGHLPKIDLNDEAKTRNFLLIIVRNLCKDFFREENKSPLYLNEVEEPRDSTPSAESSFIISEQYETARNCLLDMGQSYFDILELKAEYELSTQEIADILKISPENVRIRLHRARQHVTAILRKDET
jgi:RNA polymerase sigma-70 factor (ECF subfamily)